MPRHPYAIFTITESRGFPGLPSIRPHRDVRIADETLQEYLMRSGFEPGDVVEMRLVAIPTALPPPGQLARRPRGKR